MILSLKFRNQRNPEDKSDSSVTALGGGREGIGPGAFPAVGATVDPLPALYALGHGMPALCRPPPTVHQVAVPALWEQAPLTAPSLVDTPYHTASIIPILPRADESSICDKPQFFFSFFSFLGCSNPTI
jgi:hypothetical protein